MPPLDAFSQGYLRLTLEINRHIDGYVDSYYGPADLKAEVEAAEKKSPAALLSDLARLHDALPTHNPHRREYLETVIRAMDCTVRGLNGEQFDYLDEVYRLYDVRPQLIDEATFTAAHAQLDTLLPGSGSLADRLESWRSQFVIPPVKLPEVIPVIMDEARRRTQQLVELVPGEHINVTLVNDQPWSGYNWYQGNAHSLIQINTDMPVNALDLPDLAAHEGYPGHHTEHQLKEKHLYEENGYGETASALLHSPSAVIAEGIARTALEIIFPNATNIAWMLDTVFPAAGLPSADPEQIRRIGEARKALRSVGDNAASLYHTGKLAEEQTIDYLRTYDLAPEKRARQRFRFLSNPLFRCYIFTYTQGERLIEEAAKGGDKTPIFKRLLHEEILPSKIPQIA